VNDDRRDIQPPLPPPVEVELAVFPPHDCSYLPGREATTRGIWAEKIPAALYHAFMDRGFRRSGKLIYQTVCADCRECVPIRVLVDQFVPGKSQRRIWRRNRDLSVKVGVPTISGEKFEMYCRYLQQRHATEDAGDYESFRRFLYDSPVDTAEFIYRDGAGKLIAVGICDLCAQSLSSVYFYFDPVESRRSMGVFGLLWEIQFARKHGIPYYYLGYWVKGCGKMEYKADYRPFELLGAAGEWRRGE
jgi:leucyl-tRNA---protein transferase